MYDRIGTDMKTFYTRYNPFFVLFLAVCGFSYGFQAIQADSSKIKNLHEGLFLKCDYPGMEDIDSKSFVFSKCSVDQKYEAVYENRLGFENIKLISDGYNLEISKLKDKDIKLPLNLICYEYLFIAEEVSWEGVVPPKARIKIKCQTFSGQLDFGQLDCEPSNFPNFEVRTVNHGSLRLSNISSQNPHVFRIMSFYLGNPIIVQVAQDGCEEKYIHVHGDPNPSVNEKERAKIPIELHYYVNSEQVKKIQEEAEEVWAFSEPSVKVNDKQVYPKVVKTKEEPEEVSAKLDDKQHPSGSSAFFDWDLLD